MKKTIRIRCWIDLDGEKIFGPGRAELLKHIKETGSIAKASRSMKMSYKKAWDLVNHMNKSCKKPLVISQKGGSKGGGAVLTPDGEKIMAAYSRLNRKLTSVAAAQSKILELF